MSEGPPLEKVAADAEAALDLLQTQRGRIDELEAIIEEQRDIIAEISGRVDKLENETELVRNVGENSTPKPEVRAAVYVETLVNKARSNPNRDRAELDASGAVNAVNGNVDRTQMYGETGDFHRTVELVGNEDVLKLVKEPRGAAKNTRLVLNLEDVGRVESATNGLVNTEGSV